MRHAFFFVGLAVTAVVIGCGGSTSVNNAVGGSTSRAGGGSGGIAGSSSLSGGHSGGNGSFAGSVDRGGVGGGAGLAENGGSAAGHAGKGGVAGTGSSSGHGGSAGQAGRGSGGAGGAESGQGGTQGGSGGTGDRGGSGGENAGTGGGAMGGMSGSCGEPSACEGYDNRPNAGLVAVIACLSPNSTPANTPLTLDIFGQHLAVSANMNAVVIVAAGAPINGVPVTACHLRVQLPADRIATARPVSVVVSPGGFIRDSSPASLTVQ
jgi:hypothetical protein